MKLVLLGILIAAVILVSGCTEQKDEPLLKLRIPNQGNQIYEFTNDLREAIKVPVNDEEALFYFVRDNEGFNIVFDGSNPEDNARFQVTVFNIITKLFTFFPYEGRILKSENFPAYYYINDNGNRVWYNSVNEQIDEPDLSEPTLWLKGPNTGAEETSVFIDGNTVFIQGTDSKGVGMAGDKFILIAFGINKLE